MKDRTEKTYEFIENEKTGFWKTFEKDEGYFLYDVEEHDTSIRAKYLEDYHQSVWILNANSYQAFAEKYEVVSGGWYGQNKEGEWVGGRLRTLKRRMGTITFHHVSNVRQYKANDTTPTKFHIKKRRFTNTLDIEVSNDEIGSFKFDCKNIFYSPSDKIYLFDKGEEQFIDSTDLLSEGGFKLKE